MFIIFYNWGGGRLVIGGRDPSQSYMHIWNGCFFDVATPLQPLGTWHLHQNLPRFGEASYQYCSKAILSHAHRQCERGNDATDPGRLQWQLQPAETGRSPSSVAEPQPSGRRIGQRRKQLTEVAFSWRISQFLSIVLIWRFPKIGVPPNHPFKWDFPV